MMIGSLSEKYAKRIFSSFVDFKNSFDVLKQIPAFFMVDEISTMLLASGIEEFDYYKYHYENYHIRTTSLIDFCAKFVNEVYCLGMPSKRCNVFAVIENENLKNSETVVALKLFDNHINKIRGKRNQIIHHYGEIEFEEIAEIKSSCIDFDVAEFTDLSKKYFIQKKKEAVEKTKNLLIENNNTNIEYSRKLLETLTKPFLNHYEYLKHLENS